MFLVTRYKENFKITKGNWKYFRTKNELVKIYESFEEGENSKIVDNEFFGYTRITVEQPKVENGEVVRNNKGYPKPDSKLRDYEIIPLNSDIQEYYEKEVKPYFSDSWIDKTKTKIGYEISFNKEFYHLVKTFII